MRFKYQYDFMPAGIMTRFIVITHDLIQSELYWKDGVALQMEDAQALVIKIHSRRIEIWINGGDKKSLLQTIRRHMDYIHKPFSNLEICEMVPCICKECLENPELYFFSYDDIIKARSKGKFKIECKKSFEDVSIEGLLGEIGSRAPERERMDDEEVDKRSEPKTIKIFLASSNELNEERKEIELFVGKENRRLIDKNIFLDLVIWEDLKQSFHGKRIQDYFNEKMLECEIVLFLFYKKVGDFTKEEFEVAYEHFKQGQKPRYLHVFFKSGKVDIDEIDEKILRIRKMKNYIAEAKQIYKQFKSNAELILQLKNQFELIIPELN